MLLGSIGDTTTPQYYYTAIPIHCFLQINNNYINIGNFRKLLKITYIKLVLYFCNLSSLIGYSISVIFFRFMNWQKSYSTTSKNILKVGLSSPSKKNCAIYLVESPLFHLKSSFRSQDIQVFVMAFWSWRKKWLD